MNTCIAEMPEEFFQVDNITVCPDPRGGLEILRDGETVTLSIWEMEVIAKMARQRGWDE